MSRRKVLAALTSVLTAVALVPAATAQANPNDEWIRLVNDWGFSLTSLDEGNGTRAVQGIEIPVPGTQPSYMQAWKKVSDGGLFRFRSARTKHQYALTVNSGVDWVNKPVNVYTDTPGDPDQIWRAIPIPGTARYELKNPASGKCLGSPGDVHDSGDPLYVLACNKNMKSQRWWFKTDG
ncbi:ricin-type beta-trefoil lectin domain protein [Actinoplanes sp. Pm04-4]|uniref:Ricin-type beta-trefoil lectin domain protein n=1 Tax=Paractinoplanes pyxinae TaxID=2997416 RepID=A0ABT4B9G4_9ACTN|nr:RICIN domain-containing protein [Actinoplanes pyxinae]MCY1143149.1 ricin-type beta-trefoil lectin domain protein [Actinoplanes pyxinae]